MAPAARTACVAVPDAGPAGGTLIGSVMKLIREPHRMAGALRVRWRERTVWERVYAGLREPKRPGVIEVDDALNAELAAALVGAGLPLERFTIDLADHARFLARADYARHPAYLDGGRSGDFPEKGLEHYLAARLLGLGPDDVYIDVASQSSPVPAIYAALFGCSTYRQDLELPAGRRGRDIGGDAAAMPVPDGFASAMGLHNSFEHFEGDADTRFVHEAERVLRPGGRVCILPLFLFPTHAIQTNPAALSDTVPPFDADATLYCCRGHYDRHGRFYDLAHLRSRLLDHCGRLRPRLIEVTNARAVDPGCYLHFALVLEKPAA